MKLIPNDNTEATSRFVPAMHVTITQIIHLVYRVGRWPPHPWSIDIFVENGAPKIHLAPQNDPQIVLNAYK